MIDILKVDWRRYIRYRRGQEFSVVEQILEQVERDEVSLCKGAHLVRLMRDRIKMIKKLAAIAKGEGE